MEIVVLDAYSVNPGDIIKPLPVSQKLGSYNTVGASLGVSKDDWRIEIFGDNITDERPELYKSANDGEIRTTTSRPRTFGLRVSYKI